MFVKYLSRKFLDDDPAQGGEGGGEPVLTGGEGGEPAAPVTPAAPAAAPAAPTPAAAAPADPAAPVTPTQEGDWAPDWRSKVSSDEKHQKTLERFASPKAMFDSYMALRQRVDSGELKAAAQPFPKEGTEEEQLNWRKENGIPDTAAGYEASFDEGVVIGEADKPILADFLEYAHQSNMTPDEVNKSMRWYYDFNERQVEMQEQRDSEFLAKTEDTLRSEWGNEYRTNLNMIKGLVDTIPEDVRDLFVNARLGDGNALLNHPSMIRWMVDNARTVNPVATVVPGAGANVASAIEDEITKIEKVMLTDRKAYNADEGMQKRLRQLYDARERAK